MTYSHQDFKYIHSSSTDTEEERLKVQAKEAEKHLWHDLDLSLLIENDPKLFYLEVGCGVGAQTPALISRLPRDMRILGIDIDKQQISRANKNLNQYIPEKVHLQNADIIKYQFQNDSLSGAYICWVLEHIPYNNILELLINLKNAIKGKGAIINIETIMDPINGMIVHDQNNRTDPAIIKYLNALVECQKNLEGNANFGARENMINCYNEAGFTNVSYEILKISHPDEELEASISYSKSLFESVSQKLLDTGIINHQDYNNAISALDYAKKFTWHAGRIIASK